GGHEKLVSPKAETGRGKPETRNPVIRTFGTGDFPCAGVSRDSPAPVPNQTLPSRSRNAERKVRDGKPSAVVKCFTCLDTGSSRSTPLPVPTYMRPNASSVRTLTKLLESPCAVV